MGGPGTMAPQESENIPPKGWEKRFNDNVMAAINEGRELVEIQTGDDMRIYVSARLFPEYTWPDDGPEWKKTVVSTIRGILFDLAKVDEWPFSGTRETIDAATTFWISAAKNLEACRAGGATTLMELRLCAANATFPTVTAWPAAPSSRPWEREAWKRFVAMTSPEPGVVGPGGVAPAEPSGWEKHLDERLASAIEAGRADLSVRTSQDMKTFVGNYLFPNAQWPLPGSSAPWQVDTWKTIQDTLATLANADQWPGAGDQEVLDNAITFWVSAERSVAKCRTTLGFPGSPQPYGSVEECAAATTFPWVAWPPPTSGAAPWRYYAWQKFKALV
jgi:hypothetical protein